MNPQKILVPPCDEPLRRPTTPVTTTPVTTTPRVGSPLVSVAPFSPGGWDKIDSNDPDNYQLHRRVFPGLTMAQIQQQVTVVHTKFRAIQDGEEVEVREPRGTAWFSDRGHLFHYSGKVMTARPLPPILADLRNRLHELTGMWYCSVLVNNYPDGKTGMGYHQDPLYDPDCPERQIWADDTAVISVGDTRRFVLRTLDQRTYHRHIVRSGDVMHMFGACQATYQHAVKLEKSRDAVGPRMSLVFKRHLESKLEEK